MPKDCLGRTWAPRSLAMHVFFPCCSRHQISTRLCQDLRLRIFRGLCCLQGFASVRVRGPSFGIVLGNNSLHVYNCNLASVFLLPFPKSHSQVFDVSPILKILLQDQGLLTSEHFLIGNCSSTFFKHAIFSISLPTTNHSCKAV